MQRQGLPLVAGSRRGFHGLIATLAVAVAWLLFGAQPAAAEKVVVNEFGTSTAGAGAGSFNTARGVAINGTGVGGVPAGTVYVIDSSNARVQQFGPTGAFVRTWGVGVRDGSAEFQICSANCQKGTTSNAAGGLGTPIGIAVDQATGNVWVTNQTGRRVSIYGPAGNFHGAFGWGAIDGAPELQFCTTATGCGAPGAAASTTGNVGGGQFGTQIGNLAISGDEVYVADKSSRRVQVFKQLRTGNAVTGIEFVRAFGWGAATGAAEYEICTSSPCNAPAAAGTGLGQFATNSPADIAIDSKGNLFVLDNGNKRVQVFDDEATPVEEAFGAAAITATFGTGSQHGLAIEPGTDNLLLAASRSSSANRVAVLELDPSGDAVATHGTDLTRTSVYGLAVAAPDLGGNVYVSGGLLGHQVFVLNETKPTIDDPTAVGPRGATFEGSVVSNGFEALYRFEYSADGGQTWVRAPQPDAVAGTEPGAIPVSETVTGLKPDTTYSVRLVGTRPLGGGSATSPTVSFTTAESAPSVEESFASMISDRQARLAAYLNPENADTEFYFEYGPTDSYGGVEPVPAREIGGGTERVAVSVPLTGLAPATTYHFRVVATNASGTTHGPDRTFTTLPAASPAAERGTEMVSPPDKHGSDVIVHGNGAYSGADFSPYASADGDRVAFTSYGSFAGSPSHGVFSVYMADRSADGWDTRSLNEPLDGATYSSPFLGFNAFSPDLSRWALLGPGGPPLTPDASVGSFNAFVWEPGVGYQLATPTLEPDKLTGPEQMVPSQDFRYLVMGLTGAGLARAPLTDDTPPTAEAAVYGWSADKPDQVTYLAREPVTDEPMTGDSRIAHPQPARPGAPNAGIWNAVSADGSKVYFVNKPSGLAPYRLYVRLVDEERTIHVSESHRGEPDPNQREMVFRFASHDGSVAFFSSGEKLTDDATTGPTSSGSDLYRFEVDGEELTDITVDQDDVNGAEVQGVIGGSEDGKRIYFVARGALAPGAIAGRNNLYLWVDDGSPKGEIRYIAHGLESRNWDGLQEEEYRHYARVTPDGRHALFQTGERQADYDNAGRNTVYLYDAEADRLQCASCDPTGKPATADAYAIGSGDFQQAARTLTDDGRYAFFTTRAALVPEDVNGIEDVYQFDSDTGRADLISPGTGSLKAVFVDASADGRDVFFATREQLVRIDFDRNTDIYDARIGGGIAAQNPAIGASCAGEACRPAPVGAPAAALPASAAMNSTGNLKPGPRKAKKKKKKKAKRKQRGKHRRAKGKRGKHGKAAKRKAKHRRANGRRG